MINYGHGLIGYILTIIALIHGLLALIICVIVIILIVYHQYNNRLKNEEKTTLILSINIYLCILSVLSALIFTNIETLIGDIYGNDFNSSLCIFKGYFIASMFCAMYHAFIIQAFFRLCRIVYSNYKWIQFYLFYIIVTPIQLIEAFVLLSPLLIWQDIIYIPNDHFCYIAFIRLRPTLWAVFTIYSIPLIFLSIIYMRITIFIRKQTTQQAFAARRRQKRDLVAIQRIIINIGILVVLGIPAIVLLLMLLITGIENPLLYRISWIGFEISLALLSGEMVFMTPQLRNILLRRWQHNRVNPGTLSIHWRAAGTTAQ